MTQHFLVGKKITAVYLATDGHAIKFSTDSGEIVAKTDGDCCSNTWIENVEMPDNLLGTVQSVEDLTLREEGEDGELTQFYGCKIVTEKGICTLDYRNESNGYYGGNLSWPDDNYYYGGVYGQNVSSEEWRKIA